MHDWINLQYVPSKSAGFIPACRNKDCSWRPVMACRIHEVSLGSGLGPQSCHPHRLSIPGSGSQATSSFLCLYFSCWFARLALTSTRQENCVFCIELSMRAPNSDCIPDGGASWRMDSRHLPGPSGNTLTCRSGVKLRQLSHGKQLCVGLEGTGRQRWAQFSAGVLQHFGHTCYPSHSSYCCPDTERKSQEATRPRANLRLCCQQIVSMMNPLRLIFQYRFV